jgi:CheY-like chemotaxis protein
LVVDDEDDIRKVAQVSMEAVAGWEVLTARSGREGVARAGVEQPDAILLDVMMPEMDGLATHQQLQADPATRHIPVIFLTARVLPGDRRQFADSGVQEVIAKPFDPLKLPHQVAEALGWRL